MIRELVETVILRLRSDRLVRHFGPLRSLRIWPRTNRKPPSGSSDSILRNAALVSVALHLFAILVLPTPGSSSEPTTGTRIVLRGSVLEAAPMKTDTPSEPQPRPEKEETSGDQDLETDPVPSPSEDVAEPDAVKEQLGSYVDAAPDAIGESPQDTAESKRIDALMEQTQKTVLQNKTRERWLMMEVREQVLNNLSHLLQGNATIHQGDDRASFLVGFLIDAEGWIYDISLRPAPGVEFDAFAVRDAIAILNPLNPPPTGIDVPIELHLRVDFLEGR